MGQWHYDLAADPEPGMRGLRAAPGLLVRGLRSVAAVALRCWLHTYHRLTVVGREHLPANGRSFVLIANHASHLDTLCLLAALPLGRLDRTFPVAARDYFCATAVRYLVARVVVNALPFDRQLATLRSLDDCARVLESPGTVLIVFPEGTRSGSVEPGEFRQGIALLTAGRDLPVVPCHLAGTHAALPRGAWLPRPRAVRLTIGAPHVYAHLPPTRESARRICSELREAVMALGNVGRGKG
jgi:1-acyl-sn-glycerol-3-phosphate acyltransferase